MKPCPCTVSRPLCFLIVLMLVALSLTGVLVPLWTKHVTRIEKELKSISHNTNQEVLGLIHTNIRLASVMLVLMFGATVITICSLIYLIVKTTKREKHLYFSLINQMEAAQQSERKSMNKSLAFVSASHDIRASLAGIIGLVEMCRDEVTKRDPLWSDMLMNLNLMEASATDLLGILNSILDTSKIESGKMQLEEQEFNIEQLLKDVVDLFHPVGKKKGVDVILDQFDGSVINSSMVKGDRGKLKQILSNLLSNAVKFTLEGHVVVRAWARKPSFRNSSIRNNSLRGIFKIERACDESEAMRTTTFQQDSNRVEFVFEVVDTGKGIPKEKQSFVFENYAQVNAPGHEGTGLGLGIVQSLVRLMGGDIRIVDKELEERGTCFRFNVFLSTSDTDRSTDNLRANIFVGLKDKDEMIGGASSCKAPLMGKKILIVDDDSIGKSIATRVVSQLGADTSSCENGEKAWKLVCESLDSKDSSVRFDCILMDCEMPVMGGIEAMARIRETENVYGVRIPIIALTAHDRGEEIRKMIENGVDGYITKPLNREKFLKAITGIML